MARKIEVEIIGDSRSLERAFGRAGHSAGRLGDGFKRLGRAATVGLAVGLGATVAVAVKATKAASDLGEQINKVSVVFRGSEKDILRWSKTTAAGFGISRRAALEAAGTFGNMLVPMGFARKEAEQMSKRMVELAADMASFNNASPEDVLEALRAGLAGETEPLRRFGVFLNDVRLKQEALNLGLKDAVGPNGALRANAKAQATYSLILKDTADAQGDFQRTSGSLANQQRILKARLEDLAASIGRVFVPAAAKAASALNDILTFFGKVAKAGDVPTALKILGTGLVTFAVSTAAQMKDAFQKAIFGWWDDPSVGGPVMGEAGRNMTREFHDGLVQGLQNANWSEIGRKIAHGIGSAITFTDAALDKAMRSLLQWVQAHAQDFAEIGAEIAVRIVATLTDPAFWSRHMDLLAVLLVARFGGAALRGLGALGGRVAGRFLATLGGAISSRLGPLITTLFSRVPSWIATPFIAAGKAAGAGIMFVVNTLRGDLKRVLGAIPGWIKAAFKIGAVVSFIGWVQKAADWVHRLWNFLSDVASKVWNIVVKITVSGGGGLLNKIKGGVGVFSGIPHAAGGTVPMLRGAQRGKDSVPIMAMPGEIVVNPARPQRGLEALRDAGFEGFARGGTVGKPRRPSAIQRRKGKTAAERERARTEIPKSLQLEIATARQRHDKPRLLAALKKAAAWLRHHIGITRSIDNKISLTNELASVEDEITSLEEDGTTSEPDQSDDLRAQLGQLQARLGAAQREAAYASAFVGTGVFGGGAGNTFVFNSAWPPSPEIIDQVGRGATLGIGRQGYRQSTREFLGV